MDNDGTVLDRLFIKQAKEKDHLFHLVNQLKKHNVKLGVPLVRVIGALLKAYKSK